MAISELNHINIRTDSMEETKDFYVDVLGLEIGFRPPFDNHGYWLYSGETAIVHLSPSDPSDGGARTVKDGMGDGLDHIGLFADDLDGFEKTLQKHGVDYRSRLAAGDRLVQVFLYDPNGVLVEVAFEVASEGIDPKSFAGRETETVRL